MDARVFVERVHTYGFAAALARDDLEVLLLLLTPDQVVVAAVRIVVCWALCVALACFVCHFAPSRIQIENDAAVSPNGIRSI